jgi:hypothetical protein
VGLTHEDRVQAVVEFGFSERQARFLVTVMRHAGVCVPRQYATSAGVANGGEKTNAFFDKLVNRQYAVACNCRHNRARLFHVRHKPLYRAIGEAESRFRRAVPARRAVERLMLLDAVLTSPDSTWLTSEKEKAAYVAGLTAPVPTEQALDATVDVNPRRTVGVFRSAFPMGLDPSGRAVLLYLVTAPWTDEFRTFLQDQAASLRVVPSWTLRLVFPRPLDRAYGAYQTVVREELETPLHRATIGELKWYFEHRQLAISQGVHAQTQAFLDRAAQVFNTSRFTLLYRRWLKQGDAAFEAVSSPVFAEALAGGVGRVECLVLPHTYRHLSPLAKLVHLAPTGVEENDRGGEHGPLGLKSAASPGTTRPTASG